MSSQTTKVVTLDTSIRGLFKSLFENTIIMNGKAEHEPLKANETIKKILAMNFLLITSGIPTYGALKNAYTSTDTKRYTGDALPSIHLPTNHTQLFAGAIMSALGLTMEQLCSDVDVLDSYPPTYGKEELDYLAKNEFDNSHAWLHHFYYGIRSIDWGSAKENRSFFRLID